MNETPTASLAASLAQLPVTLRDVETAAGVLEGFVKRTSFERSRTLSDITGAGIWLKFENLQFTATFKERGALNRLSALSADERRTRRDCLFGRQPRPGCGLSRRQPFDTGNHRHAGGNADREDREYPPAWC